MKEKKEENKKEDDDDMNKRGFTSTSSIENVIKKQLDKLSRTQYEVVVIGNTNAGKSTFLTNITKMSNFFNTGVNRETASVWRFKVDRDLTNNDATFQMIKSYV